MLTLACIAGLLSPKVFFASLFAAGQPPTVSIVAPIDGAVAINTNDLVISVSASDPDGAIVKVGLFRDGQFLGQSLSAPYQFTLINPSISTNLYTAVATDNAGNSSTSAPVMVFVEAPLPPYFPPSVLLTAAGTNLQLIAPASLSLTAAAEVYRDGLDRFDFQAVYAPLGSAVVAGEGRLNPSTLTLSNLAVGDYVFTVIARDIYGGATISAEVKVSVVPPADLAIPLFQFTDLGTIGGEESSASAINQFGAVVGTSSVTPHSQTQRAYLWRAGAFRGVPYPPGLTFGYGLNDLGHACGSLAEGGAIAGAFVWSPAAGITVLPILGTQAEAYALNEKGEAVGWSGGPNSPKPAVWTLGANASQPPQITLLSPGRQGQARAINRTGRIAGYVINDGFSSPRAVLWENGQERDLGVEAALNGQQSMALGINTDGQIVGRFNLSPLIAHGFLWENGVTRQMTPLVGSSGGPVAINDHGWSVGSSKPVNNFVILEHAVLWLAQTPFDLNTLVTNLGGATLLNASAVNNQGQIVGTAFVEGQRHAFLLEPASRSMTPAPPSVVLANPVTGNTVPTGEPVTLLANVQSGADSVDRVEFYVGDSVVATVRDIPYTASWVPEVPGDYVIRALALDATERAGASAAALLTAKTTPPPHTNVPPAVAIELPTGALQYEGDSVPLLVSANDTDGTVTLVFLSSGTNVIGSILQPPYTLTWSNLAAGTYSILATAFDDLGAARTSAPVTLTVRAVNSSAPAVALVGHVPADISADIRQHLRRTELFSRVDILGSAPSQAQLAAYASVLVCSQTASPLPLSLGNLLADYVDAGGGLAVSLYASDTSRQVLQGRLVDQGYLPWSNEQLSSHGHAVMLKDLPDHPVLSGVVTFDGGPSAVYGHDMALAPGALRVASWDTHDPLAVVREVGAGRLVGLNLNPVSGAVTSLGWDTNSDGARLLGNSLLWAATGPSNRLSLSTDSTNHNAYYPGESILLAAAGTQLAATGMVRYYSDGNLLGLVTNLPATFIWSNAPVGSHLLVATHTDPTGRVVATPGVSVTIDSRQTVELITPTNGAIVYLPTNLLMQVAFTNKDSTVVEVEYYLDQTQRLATVRSAPFSFDFKLLPTGTYRFSAVVIDALGARRSSAPHTVTIVNTILPHLTKWQGGDDEWFTPAKWTAGPPRPQDPAVIDLGLARLKTGEAFATNLTIALSRSGSMVLEGGALSVGNTLMLGDQPGSTGSIRLTASARLTADEFVVGLRGTGSAVQEGGSVSAAQLLLSADVGGTGSYDLNEGNLTIANEVIGGLGTSRFIQRGGVHTAEFLQIGSRAKSWGTYELSAGRLITRITAIGANESNPGNLSTLIQTGGFQEVLEELRVGTDGDSGRLVVSGGSLEVANLVLDTSWLELVADPAARRVKVSGSATLGGVLQVQLPSGYVPLGGDTLTLMTYGSRRGTFALTNLPPATNGVVWTLEYQPTALLLRAMPPPESVIISAITATQQEGLFQQTVTFSNHETVALEGLRLYFPGLPSNWQLYNGSGTEEGVPFLEVAALIPPVSSIQFTVQFLISSETRPARQSYVVRRGSVHDAGTPPLPLMVEKAAPRVDGAFELRFTSELNGTYRIQYSRDLQDWQSVPQSVMATGGQTHWVDDGPPKTVSKPSAEHLRFYRILRLP